MNILVLKNAYHNKQLVLVPAGVMAKICLFLVLFESKVAYHILEVEKWSVENFFKLYLSTYFCAFAFYH